MPRRALASLLRLRRTEESAARRALAATLAEEAAAEARVASASVRLSAGVAPGGGDPLDAARLAVWMPRGAAELHALGRARDACAARSGAARAAYAERRAAAEGVATVRSGLLAREAEAAASAAQAALDEASIVAFIRRR